MSLGKILLIFLLPIFLNAKVILNAPKTFYKGEIVEFSIIASGANVEIPDINNINGIPVQNVGTSTQTNIINGKRSDKIIKSFIFRPKNDLTIPAFLVKVDGKVEKTKPKKLKAIKVEKTKSSLYELDIKVDNKTPYVGESIYFTLTFKYKRDLDILSLEFEKPDFENFWVKELKTSPLKPSNDGYVHQELSYILFPQKAGKMVLGPLKIGVVTRDGKYGNNSFFMTTSTKTTPVYSNSINLDIKQLPKDIKLVGEFDIKTTIDKQNINQGEAVSYKVIISGKGNIDDIDEIKLDLPNSTIYENPSKKEYNIDGNKYGGVYTKVFSIVPTKDITIPSVSLSYFDKNEKKIKNLKTKVYDIKVNGIKNKSVQLEVANDDLVSKVKEQAIIKQTIKTTTDNQKLIYFIFGVLLGVLLTIIVVLILKNKKVKKEDTPILKTIKSSNSSAQLLKQLVAYINIDKELDKMIYSLEHRLSKEEFKKIKTDIIKYFKNNDIK